MVLDVMAISYSLIDDTLVGGFDCLGYPGRGNTPWVGKVYVEPGGGVVYFQPGDTIHTNLGSITKPGLYQRNYYCDGQVWTLSFSCSYMPDSLELYYLSHFSQAYADSIQRAKDSLAVITAYLSNPPNAVLFPNPVIDNIFLKDLFYEPTNVEISIYDMNGRNVIVQNFEVPSGLQSKIIDLSMLEHGIYILRYKAGATHIVKRIVKI